MKMVIATCALLLSASLMARGQDYKAYSNYDFVAGDRIIFEDDFRADQDGEFPAHWKLISGQAVVNKFQGEPAFALTEGNYAKVEPRISVKTYLPESFTIELDFFAKSGGFESIGFFLHSGEDDRTIMFGPDVSSAGLEHDLAGTFPGGAEAFVDKWHHLALAFKNGQMKCYEDQNRVLVIPDFGTFKAESVSFGGIGDQENPLLFKNVRIAGGGGMNMIDRLTKDGKIVTHGINFAVNSSTIKPESMGTINEIAKMMKANAAVKLEIGGHTDSTGDAAQNLTLSQSRADAVKKMLVDQGIDAARLTTKGYGATKPLDKNDTLEGKANNRRVELTKVG